MTTYFISRHAGAQEWAREEGIEAIHIDHLDVSIIAAGDVVIGTLPIHLAAEVCAREAKFLFLAMDLTPALREKKELTAQDMRAANARLEAYAIRKA